MNNIIIKKFDLFIISGNKIFEKIGIFLVTSVGENSNYNKMMFSLQIESENFFLNQISSSRGLDRNFRFSVNNFHPLSITCVLMLIWI
jgi:hypothetical protein